MASKLVNFRLDEERLRKIKVLRAKGVAMSDLVREAIDERYSKLNNHRTPRDVKAIMKRILEKYPDPPNLPHPQYNVHDRKEARNAILRKLRGKQR